MKKLFVTLLFLLSFVNVFAKEVSAQDYFDHAKFSEQNAQYVTALGSYWDAICLDPVNSKEALTRFEKLASKLQDGVKMFEDLNRFQVLDEWTKILKEAEQYFTLNFIYDFSFSPWEIDSSDYRTRTASFRTKVTYNFSKKFETILNIVCNGYRNAYQEEWEGVPSPKYWPKQAVTPIPELGQKTDFSGTTYNYSYTLSKDNKLYLTDDVAMFGVNRDDNNVRLYNSFYNNGYSVYINVVDENQNEIKIPVRYALNAFDVSHGSFEILIEGVKEYEIKLFEKQLAKPNVSKVLLKYGYKKTWNELKEKVEEVEVSLDTAHFRNQKYRKINSITEVEKLYPVFDLYKDNKNFVLVEGSEVLGPVSDSIAFAENTRHRFFDFYMCNHEVTQEEYNKVMGISLLGKENLQKPITSITFLDAVIFCNRLSQLMGYSPCYYITDFKDVILNKEANGYRLPTKEEWEYAARGGKNNLATSTKYAGDKKLDKVAWYIKNSKFELQNVKTKKANQLGLYDMSGNVWEFCNNEVNVQYDEDTRIELYRYIKGGSYCDEEELLNINYSEQVERSRQSYKVGFRLVRNAW